MNPNPYPAGRWTTRGSRARANKSRCGVRIQSESVALLRQAPLRELFWAAEDSSLVEDARLRVEAAIASALAADPLPITDPTEATGELQAA